MKAKDSKGSTRSLTACRRSWLVSTAVLLLAACAEGNDSASMTTSSVTDSTAPADSRFDPPCTDLEASDRPIPVDDPLLDTLKPLGGEPVVQVTLPRIVDAENYSDRLRPRVKRIPGGMLVALHQFVEANSSFGTLFAVDVDGTVRWRRCLDPAPDTVAVAEGADVDEFLLGWTTIGSNGSVTRTFEVWSLIDGSRSHTWDDLLAANDITGDATQYRRLHRLQSSTFLALGPTEERDIEATDSMVILDLATWTMRTVPYPPHTVGTPFDLVDLGVTENGSLVEFEEGSGIPGGRAQAVESSGTWSDSLGDLNSAVGSRVDFLFGESVAQLAGFDAQGNVNWRRDDVFDIQAEGFRVGIDGDVALVSACAGPSTAEVWCPGPSLLAVDVATGETVWQHEGRWAVSVFGDGHAIVSGPYTDATTGPPPPWEMIDLKTGDRTASTVWGAPWRFDVGCCDSPEEAWVVGGVVFTLDGDSIEMWYPEDMSTPLEQVGIDSGQQ